jgi:hypothetical protein
MIHFYDSASPENVPSGVHACVYVNGFAWGERQIERMGAVRRISVLKEASWAKVASIIDVENGAADPTDVVPFLHERLAHGQDDGTAYVNRSNLEQVRSLVQDAKLKCLFWVATLDGTMTVEGAWAVQYHGGITAPYDLSVLHGVNYFHKP